MLPDDFNWETYISINEDVKLCFPTEELATKHYLTDGIKQKRMYKMNNVPEDFDWESYLILNPDVYNHVKKELAAALKDLTLLGQVCGISLKDIMKESNESS